MTQGLTVNAGDHPVTTVTIFKSSKAEVTRTFTLDLESGQNKIEITGLPSCIETDSVRVTGLGAARLFDVTCTVAAFKSGRTLAAHDPREHIRKLTAKRKLLESEKRVREHEADILVDYGKSLRGDHVQPDQASAFMEGFVKHGRKNLEATYELEEQIVQIEREIKSEEERLAKRAGAADGQVTLVIAVDQDGPAELKVTYIVTNASWKSAYDLYACTENSQPTESVKLHYRAQITQSTGEDWTDAALVLSTAASDTIARIPVLPPMRVAPPKPMFGRTSTTNNTLPGNGFVNLASTLGPAPAGYNIFGDLFGAPAPPPGGLFGGQAPPQQAQQAQQDHQQTFLHSFMQQGRQAEQGRQPLLPPTGFGQTLPQQTGFGQTLPSRTGGLFGQSAAAPVTDPVGDNDDAFSVVEPVAEPLTVISESALALTYAVDGKSTVPSDGIAHRVLIAALTFEATTEHIVVPRAATAAYLQCAVKNTSDYRLLPGPVSVFLDDSFVSKTSINDVNSGERFTCMLGADAALHVTYARTASTANGQGGAFAEQHNKTTYVTKIALRNTHRYAVQGVVVRDGVPLVGEPLKERAKVLLRKPAGLADAQPGESVRVGDVCVRWARDGGDKNGTYEWVCDVGAGKEVQLEGEFEVRAPADVAWSLTS